MVLGNFFLNFQQIAMSVSVLRRLLKTEAAMCERHVRWWRNHKGRVRVGGSTSPPKVLINEAKWLRFLAVFETSVACHHLFGGHRVWRMVAISRVK